MTVDAKGANGHVHWIVATLRGKFNYDTLVNMMSPLHWVAGSIGTDQLLLCNLLAS